MKRKRLIFAVSVITFLIIPMFFSTNVLSEEVTITGKVNDNYQIVTEDGQLYEVADTDKGNEVVLQYVGNFVKVVGTIKESDVGEKIITVTSYEVKAAE
ncbi:MAG: hypothetical protein QME06_07480 [Desulfobacterales bacterium]|nr:hypothetical protein [Desulfobacterales bacterium]